MKDQGVRRNKRYKQRRRTAPVNPPPCTAALQRPRKLNQNIKRRKEDQKVTLSFKDLAPKLFPIR
jgi:hypothetical protein